MKDVNTHLGRTATGEVRPSYVTPDKVDPTLLVGVPRQENREAYGIQSEDFFGYDRWNCYEFSTLTKLGFPLSGSLQILYPGTTKNIVESKSLKLYLNSYNLDRMKSVRVDDLKVEVERRIYNDFKEQLGIEFPAIRFTCDGHPTGLSFKPPLRYRYVGLEEYLLESGTWNEEMVGQPYRLVEGQFGIDRLSCAVRSNCKVTHQPDWGRVYISAEPNDLSITPESLFSMVVSLRNANHFHEEICEMLYHALEEMLKPKNLMVACLYLRRGGIDINPIRASSLKFLEMESHSPIMNEIAGIARQ